MRLYPVKRGLVRWEPVLARRFPDPVAKPADPDMIFVMLSHAGLRSLLLLLASATGGHLLGAPCESLLKLQLKDTSIRVAEQVTGGSFTPPGDASAKPITGLPPFCRVAGSIAPTSDSDIRFEVWLPLSGWNGKFQGLGNGGFAGYIAYGGGGGLAGAIKRGYAAASTDTGHRGSPGAAWALGHREKLVDYGYRAIHEMTVKAKAIVRAFYESPAKRAYFASCSNGGRQALMEAQRYPEDYDGIIAGAPANYFTALLTGFIWNLQGLHKGPILPGKWAAIEAAVNAQCDARDGVADGVLDDPRTCKFDPSAIACKGEESDACLTSAQMNALRRIYSGPKHFPGFDPGAESGSGGWAAWIGGENGGKSAQYGFGTEFLKYMVFGDANYDYLTFDFDRDLKVVEKRMAKILDSTDPDLSKFRARGGKLIIYHGWNDAAIPARNSINYVASVKKTMGAATADSFLRLYMVPGMKHCGGGPGPHSFGVNGEDEDGMFRALVRWVEEGVPPASINATKFNEGGPAKGVNRTRPLCPYPQVAKYKGTGSTDEAENFNCKVP